MPTNILIGLVCVPNSKYWLYMCLHPRGLLDYQSNCCHHLRSLMTLYPYRANCCASSYVTIPLLFLSHSFFVDFDETLTGSQLEHVRELNSLRKTPDLSETEDQGYHQLPILISDGLPPVPARLVKRIKQGIFVEMSELLPDHLGSADANVEKEDRHTNKTKLNEVNNIINWIQCFGIYIAVLSRSTPERVADLVGYQSLIISASHYQCAGHWVVYDRRFRLKTLAANIKIWSAIDITIWNMVFPNYPLGTYQPGQSQLMIPANTYRPPRQPAPEPKFQICLKWNENPEGCSRASCRFDHICYRCVHNPRILDKNHKAIECPHRERGQPLSSKRDHQH